MSKTLSLSKQVGMACSLVVFAALLKAFLTPLIKVESPFLLFFSAIVLSAIYGGFQAGVFATLLSALVVDYFFLEPIHIFFKNNFHQFIRLGIFTLEGLTLTFLIHRVTTSQDRLAHANIRQQHIQTTLDKSEARFRHLIEEVSEYAIFGLDAQGYIETWNLGAERIKGYKAQEIIGKHFSVFYTPEDRALGLPDKILQLAEQEKAYKGEGWRIRKDGTRFYANFVLTAVYAPDGHLQGYSKVTRDVTESRRAENEIRRLNAELEQRVEERTQELEDVNKQLESFTYTVSHDLRAPLRAIEGFSNILMTDYLNTIDPIAQEYIQRIVVSTERMDMLIQDLLSYSRLGRSELNLQNLELSTIVKMVLADIATQLEQRQAKVTVNVATHWVKAHQSTLVQIITNLLLNAVKFVEAGIQPNILIRSEDQPNNCIRLIIEDNGIGIAPEHQKRIFNIFERLHGVETYPGTGIGLAIVSKGVERMGGIMEWSLL